VFTEGNLKTYENTIDSLIERYGEVAAWKIAGLFFGVRDQTGKTDPLNPNSLKRAGFSAARNILIAGKVPVKLPTQYSMIGAGKSPLTYDGTKLHDLILNRSIEASDYQLKVPKEVTILLPTASGTVGMMAFSGCALRDKGKQCQFCILPGAERIEAVKPEQVVKELALLYNIGYNPINLTINTGQPVKKEEDLRIVGDIARKIKETYPKLPLAAEVGPFSFLSELSEAEIKQTVERCGLDVIDTFMINVEMIRNSVRKQLCPGKPSLDKYLSIIDKLTDLNYSVSTVLQLNFYPEMQDSRDYINFFRKLAEIGKGKAVPELLISRAVPGSRLEDPYWKDIGQDKTDTLDMMIQRFSNFKKQLMVISMYYNEVGFDASRVKSGCVRCGMCNVNYDISINK
jgi:hypothetical protein